MANEVRGEVELDLAGETFALRPTFEALCTIENRLGAGILEVARRIAQHQIGLRDVTVIIVETARAAGHKAKEPEIGARILDAGLCSVVPALVELLGRPLLGPPEGNAPTPPVAPSA